MTRKLLRNALSCLSIMALSCCLISNVKAQVTVTSSGGTANQTYLYLSAAFAAINNGTHSDSIVVELTANVTDTGVSVLNSSGAGLALYRYISVHPSVNGITLSYASLTGRGVIELNGADTVIIDGDNPYTAGINKDLTITNTASNTTTYTSVIRVASSGTAPFSTASNLVIKNLIINGSATGRNISSANSSSGSENTTFGIVVGPNGGLPITSLTSINTSTNSSLRMGTFTVDGCAINACARGIAFHGGSSANAEMVNITNNSIGNPITLSGFYPFTNPLTTVYSNGIYIRGTTALNISDNTISNIISYLGISTSGIELGGSFSQTGVLNILRNTINGVIVNTSSSNSISGILVSSASFIYKLGGNTITNVINSGSSTFGQPNGIKTTVTGGSVIPIIEYNKISKIYNYNPGTFGANGIHLQAGNNDTIRNNFIWDINQDISATNTTFNVTNGVYGIRIGSGTSNGANHYIYHNTIHLSGAHFGTQTEANKTSFALCLTTNTQTNTNIYNNVLSNTMTGGGPGSVHASIFLPSGGTSTMNLKINNNVYYSGTNSTNQAIAKVGVTAGTGIYLASNFNRSNSSSPLDLRSYTSTLNTTNTNDLNSFGLSSPAPFISNNDLHFILGAKTPAESKGIPSLTPIDIDGDIRPGPSAPIYGGSLAPDIGADEGDFSIDSLIIGSITGTQFSGLTAPNIVNQRIHRIAIQATGNTILPTLTSLMLNTVGTTNTYDISAAHVYYTGNDSNFNNSSLFGSMQLPFGSFNIAGNQTIYPGINYLWITYDLTGTALSGNILDLSVDNLVIGGVTYTSANPNPAGEVTVSAPMTYMNSLVSQNDTSNVATGSADNEVIGIRVITSSTGVPIQLTQLNITSSGINNLTDITNAKVWYTGNNNIFSTTNQFGNTINSPAATFSFSGVQTLLPDTNYFWVTYSISSLAVIGTYIDAECTSLVLGGNTHNVSISSASGSRKIRAEYCSANNTSGSSNCISNVTLNTLNYTTVCTGGYSNYTSAGGSATTTLKKSVKYNLSVTIGGTSNAAIWVDWNSDGYFTTNEFTFIGTGTGTFTVPLSVPCEAVTGTTRMRIRSVNSSTNLGSGSSCNTLTNSESEDYLITITDSAVGYVYSTAIQQTGVVTQTRTSKEILRVPISMRGCGIATLTKLDFNTTGTTNTAPITQATLYSTGSASTFNVFTARQLATTWYPSGNFSFLTNDTLLNNDTTNYWLAYDISNANIGDIFDAELIQVEVSGIGHTITTGNPAGNIIAQAAMSYSASEIFPKDSSKVIQGSTNNVMLGLRVITSSTGAPIAITQLNFNAGNTSDTAEIRNIKVYYTGNNNIFSAVNMFGNVLTKLPGGTSGVDFSIAGHKLLANDTNYFWLTYDIPSTAVINNFVNAACTSIVIEGIQYTPLLTHPINKRQIRSDYCIPGPSNTSPCTISSFTAINSVITTGGSTNINNTTSGCNSTYYNYYPSQVLTIKQNETFQITLANIASGTDVAKVWIDYNQDGLFANEESSLVAIGSNFSGQITIPCSASIGLTRMRVRNAKNATSATLTSCATLGGFAAAGEVEDYLVNILPGLPNTYTYSTTIQQTEGTTPGAYNVPILRIPIKTSGCGNILTTSNFKFSTIGSTNSSDIMMAKLYRTDNNRIFNTTKPIDSVAFPSGQFTFLVSDTLLSNDTTNYWLVYDISITAQTTSNLDATFDSVLIDNQYRKPVISNPSGVVPLPVKLIVFSAKKDKSDVVLSWATAGEQNNKGFGVERLKKGQWEKIGFVKGQGNSSVHSSYHFLDKSPFTGESEIYYRLKQVDFNDKFTYSSIIAVSNSDREEKMSIRPNPFNANFTVNVELAEAKEVTILVYDLQGKLVMEQQAQMPEGANALTITTPELKNGFYFATIKVGNQTHVVKLVKN